MANGKSLRDIHKAIAKVAAEHASEAKADPGALSFAYALAKRAKRAEAGGAPILLFLRKSKAYEAIMAPSREEARKAEERAKAKAFADEAEKAKAEAKEAEEARKGKKGADPLEAYANVGIFYLCSEHSDCAEDHEDWQGKPYIDRYWRRLIKDEGARAKIAKYVADNGIRSMQWVINRPVWLVTRPNCRHYFRRLGPKDVLGRAPSSLAREQGMWTPKGARDSRQTISHPTNKGWYDRASVEDIIRKYEDRKRYHEMLKARKPSQELDDLILKDDRLIRKWKAYLKTKVK